MAAEGGRVLVVDDEPSLRDLLSITLRRAGYRPLVASSRAEAAAVLAKGGIDVVVTDVRLPDGDGIEILRHVKAATPETAVIVMTAYGTTESAVAAMKLGAADYLLKPFDVEELQVVVRSVLERRDLVQENRRLRADARSRSGLDHIIGASPAMQALFDLVRAVAPTSSTILISGESGTGKELVARAIHSLSPRSDAPFVSINCGALPETLLESELFGHVKGAFTDAHQAKKGLFEVADGGTLFLDEVGETPPAMQVKLLRALQERQIRRVGGTEEIDVEVRVISATNTPLEELVQMKRFREDLFYRLQVIPIRTPPLRERREDIPILARHFLDGFCREMGKGPMSLSDDAGERLLAYDWPGNVRELENVLERAVALESSGVIHAQRLPLVAGTSSTAPRLGEGFSLDQHLAEMERTLLHSALKATQGDRQEAARLLGVSARSLRYLIQKHGSSGPP